MIKLNELRAQILDKIGTHEGLEFSVEPAICNKMNMIQMIISVTYDDETRGAAAGIGFSEYSEDLFMKRIDMTLQSLNKCIEDIKSGKV